MSRSGGALEQQFLLLLLREELSGEAHDRAAALLKRFDPPDFLHLARHHYLVPWICMAADRHPELFDEILRERLWALWGEQAPGCFHLTDILLDLLDRLEREGIPALPYKGPALAQRLYGSLLARPFGDLDLLVAPKDLPAAERIARGMGFRPRWRVTPRQERAMLLSSSHLELELHTPFFALLDLHWAPFPNHLACRIQTEELLRRSGWTTLAGRRVRVLREEDLLLLLAVHCVKHHFERLNWLKDLDRLIRTAGPLDWDGLMKEARRLRVERMFLLCLRVVAEALETPLPPVIARESARPPVAGLAMGILTALQVPPGPVRLSEKVRFFTRVREDVRDRAAYTVRFFGILCAPTFEEWERWRLPDRWFFLYYLYRPVRLAARRFFGIGRESVLHERCGA